MTIPLRDYLAQRRADVQASIKALKIELMEIDAAERALSDPMAEAIRPRRPRGTVGSGKKTLKEMAVDVLRETPEGLEAAAILANIKDKFGADVARESLSPQLSRLGQDGTLERQGLRWRLALYGGSPSTHVQNDETPDAPTSDVPSLEEDLDDEIPF